MKELPVVAVLGAGNGGSATAADLTMRGFKVNLWEHPRFRANIEPYLDEGGIGLVTLPGTGIKEGFAKVKLITTDLQDALKDAEIVFVIVPAFAHSEFASMIAPYLQNGQTVVLTPGNFFGAMEFSHQYKLYGHGKDILFAEAECMIYACRKKNPQTIWIRGRKRKLRFSAFPASKNRELMRKINIFYNDAIPAKNIFETGMSNPNSTIHVPIMLMNAGLIDRPEQEFLFYSEGLTPIIGQVIERADEERMKIGAAFNTPLLSVYEQDIEWYGDQGASGVNIYESTGKNPLYQWSKAPKTFEDRYLTEDVPYGLASIESLKNKASVDTPIITSLINLTEAVLDRDLRKEGRTLERYGLENRSIEEIVRYVELGY